MERIVAIIDAVKSGSYPNCSTLAKDLEVSNKTIQRDVNFIRDRLGYPITYDESLYGYTFSEEVDDMSSFDVQVEDLAALFLAKHTMSTLRGTKLADAMRPSFEKLANMMDGKVSLAPSDIDQVFSVKSAGVVEADLTMFGKLAEAVLKQHAVSFKYRKVGDRESGHRKLHPYHVGEVSGGWYVVGYDVDRKGIRTFALQRMKGVRVLKESFERPENFSVGGHFKGGIGVWNHGSGKLYDVRLVVTGWVARVVQERTWHASQRIQLLDDFGEEVEVRMQLSALEDIMSLVLSWGRHVKIKTPKKLKQMVAVEIEHMQH